MENCFHGSNSRRLGEIFSSLQSHKPEFSHILVYFITNYIWASRVAQLVRIRLQGGRPGFDPWVGKIPWRREQLPTPAFWSGETHGLYTPWGRKE